LITLKASIPLSPNFTLPNTRLLFVSVRSTMPVPLSATCCGLLAALSLSVSVAPCGPVASGVNATPSVQDFLGATVTGIAPHVPVPRRAYSAGSDDVALEMISELVFPVLVTVRFFATVWPTATLPNASEAVTDIEVVGVAVAVGVGVAVAVAVDVDVTVAVAVAVAVVVAVAVGVAVAVLVDVAVAVGVAVAVAVFVGVGVAVGVAVAVAVAVRVGVEVAVAVAVAVGVAAGDPNAITRLFALTVPIPVAKSQPAPAAYAA
jgi:hypothetical protein